MYTEKGNSMSALKALGFWLDGEMYDHAAFAEDTSNRFKRKASESQLTYYNPSLFTVNLRLERSSLGSLLLV